MKTILLLGGYGFIGTNILKFVDNNDALNKDYNFIVFDRVKKHPHGLSFKCVKRSYSGNFATKRFDKIFEDNDISFVLHSLSSTIPATDDDALLDIRSNLIPTLNLLNTMKAHGVKDIIYISSGGAIYGDKHSNGHRENEAVFPKSSYGILKFTIERYLLSFAQLYNFNTLILRLSNPFGKYHYNNRQGVINIAIRKALSGEKFEIWGDGKGVKDYIYIDDFCDILFILIRKGIKTKVYNVGGKMPLSVNEIADTISKFHPSFVCVHKQAAMLDVQSFELNLTQLERVIGKDFHYHKFENSVKETFEWQMSTTEQAQ